MSNEFIAQFISQFILYAIGVVVLYLNQRAINKGNQDDIKRLTRITEATKKEFTDKTEELKAQLSLSTQHKLTVKKFEAEAIFDYNKKLSNWIINLIRYNIYTNSTLPSINKNFQNLQNMKRELVFSESHLELFINDSEFEILKDKLNAIAGDFEVIKFSLARKFYNDVVTFYSEQMESINPADEFAFEEHNRNYNESVRKFKDNEPDDYKQFLKATQKAFRDYKAKVNNLLLTIEQTT